MFVCAAGAKDAENGNALKTGRDSQYNEKSGGTNVIERGISYMLKHFHFTNRRFQSLSIIVLLALTLLGCYAQKIGNTSSAEAAVTPISPHQETSHILVQLFQAPGFLYPSINGVPEWTLYADGLLIFKSSNSFDLVQAHLSPDRVRSILNVIIHQNTFFASVQPSYGRPLPDVGSLLLSVDSNGQYKQVRLYGKPGASMDEQTRHIFAIRDFLLHYHPAKISPYTPPGIALLALPQEGNTTGVLTWPYKDISLARIAILECRFFPSNVSSCPSDVKSRAGIVGILGQRGLALLQRAHTTFYTLVQEQGKTYRLIIWPLLPDALYLRKNAAPSIEIQGSNSGTWPLYLTYIRSARWQL